MSSQEPYWNPVLETLPRDKLRPLQLEKFKDIFQWAYDHAGATEIGAWSYECQAQPGGMHVNEALFLVEIEDMETGEIIREPGREGKMVITALDRQAQSWEFSIKLNAYPSLYSM